MSTDDARLARLEEQVKTLFVRIDEVREAVTSGQRDTRDELRRLGEIFESSRLLAYQVGQQAEDIREITGDLEEVREWMDFTRGRGMVIAGIVAFVLSTASALIASALTLHFQ